MVLAFFIECSCPPHRRGAIVGGGDFSSVEEFLQSYQLTHIVCQSCDSYYQLIGYMDEHGKEHLVDAPERPEPRKPGLVASLRSLVTQG
jgi:hypothetical protein